MPQLNQISVTDSVLNDTIVYKHLGAYQPHGSGRSTSILNEHINERFIQETNIDYTINAIQNESNDWMVYVLLILTLGISIIWYYMPERAISLFNFEQRKRDFHSRENVNTETPGMVILFFFMFNYFVTASLFLFLSLNSFYNEKFLNLVQNEYILYLFISVIVFSVFRILIIFFTGFIFDTEEPASNQLKLYLNVDNIIGVFLIPILFLLLFVQIDYVIYIGIFILIILHIFRWFQTFMLGKSIPGFSILHLFMYLCTLEIIPLIILMKLFSTELI